MARDPGLEALIEDDLGSLKGLTTRAMFGGWVWLLHGNLLCGARQRGLLARIGPENQTWALNLLGVTQMVMRGHPMTGWVNADPQTCADDALRQRLLTAALSFVCSLPPR